MVIANKYMDKDNSDNKQYSDNSDNSDKQYLVIAKDNSDINIWILVIINNKMLLPIKWLLLWLVGGLSPAL